MFGKPSACWTAEMPKLVSHGNASASRCLCIGLGNQMFSSGVARPVLTAREFIFFSKTDG